jgi:predicted enzyme related to lactoylglutathione lyase
MSFITVLHARQQEPPAPPTVVVDPPIVIEPPMVPDTPMPVATPAATPALAPIAGQVTFLYYRNPAKAAQFYEDVLGLESTHDLGWVRIYAVTPTASLGVVDASSGGLRPSADKSVMISFVVQDVDRWYEQMKARGLKTRLAPADSKRVNVRSFAFNDPEGYSLEVFSWLPPAPQP